MTNLVTPDARLVLPSWQAESVAVTTTSPDVGAAPESSEQAASTTTRPAAAATGLNRRAARIDGSPYLTGRALTSGGLRWAGRAGDQVVELVAPPGPLTPRTGAGVDGDR